MVEDVERERGGDCLLEWAFLTGSSGLMAGVVMMVRVGLLGRSGAGACPNLLQRRSGPGSAARRSAEYQRLSSGAPARSGPLQQIRTTGAAADPREGRRGSDGDHGGSPRRRDVHFALESAVPTVVLEGKTHVSRAKCASQRGRGRPRSSRTAAPVPSRSISSEKDSL